LTRSKSTGAFGPSTKANLSAFFRTALLYGPLACTYALLQLKHSRQSKTAGTSTNLQAFSKRNRLAPSCRDWKGTAQTGEAQGPGSKLIRNSRCDIEDQTQNFIRNLTPTRNGPLQTPQQESRLKWKTFSRPGRQHGSTKLATLPFRQKWLQTNPCPVRASILPLTLAKA
jgi:hypothetical protein